MTVHASEAAPTVGRDSLDESMTRLSRLLGIDEGVFILALHCFVESIIHEVYPPARGIVEFPALIRAFQSHLEQNQQLDRQDIQAFKRLLTDHPKANAVRHDFMRLARKRRSPLPSISSGSAGHAESNILSWARSRRGSPSGTRRPPRWR